MRIVVFDLDGTLFDTRGDIAAAVNHARKAYVLPELTLENVTSMVGDGIGLLTARAFEGTSVPLPGAQETILQYYLEHPADLACMYEGVKEVLPLIPATCAIVSNKPKKLVDSLLVRHAIDGYFSYVAGGDSFKERKPDPVAVRHIMEKFQVSAEQILVVGDHTPDIEMARRTGIKSVYCRYGFFGNDTVGADYQIDSFQELLPLVTKWVGE